MAILVGAVTTFVLSLRKHRRATELAASCWRERPKMSDGEFVKTCEIPDDPLMIQVALAARRVIAGRLRGVGRLRRVGGFAGSGPVNGFRSTFM
jgi:hypothetical protein